MFDAKNGSKKELIFQKLDHFENWQKRPQSKGYTICKIATLGQKFKMQKNMLKAFLQEIPLVLCKNSSGKELIFEKWDHSEDSQKRPRSKGYSLCKVVSLSQKVTMQKSMLKTFLQHNTVDLCEGSKRRLIFEKWDRFENWQNWPPGKGHRLCKSLTWGQKLKMQKKKQAKNIFTRHCSCSMPKMARKNS